MQTNIFFFLNFNQLKGANYSFILLKCSPNRMDRYSMSLLVFMLSSILWQSSCFLALTYTENDQEVKTQTSHSLAARYENYSSTSWLPYSIYLYESITCISVTFLKILEKSQLFWEVSFIFILKIFLKSLLNLLQ